MHRQNEISEILSRVDGWSPEDRVALAYQILGEVRSTSISKAPRRTFNQALGIGRGVGPALTDQQVEDLMQEHRQEKFG